MQLLPAAVLQLLPAAALQLLPAAVAAAVQKTRDRGGAGGGASIRNIAHPQSVRMTPWSLGKPG